MVACCRVHTAGGVAVTRITERMMRAGSFSIDLKPETPESVRSVIRAAVGQDPDGTSSPTHGHFVVTVARLPVDSVTAPGGIYTGRLVAQESRNSFSGVGLAGWLGVNGQTGPRVKTRTAAARDAQAIVSISLANGITAGSITPAGGPTVQESEFGMVTYSERLSAMARQLGHEWHINTAGELNVADAADLYPVTPAVMFTDLTAQLSSFAGGIRLVDSDARAPKIQAGQRASVTRAVLTLEPPTTVDTAPSTVAYDIDGNVAALHRHIDHLNGTAITGATLAAEVQDRFGNTESDFSIGVNGDRWRLFVNPGELCYAYFPTAGIRDLTNLIDIGGTTFPRLLRIQQVDWAPSEGDGVYFVPAPGQGGTIDLSDWFVPGVGGSVTVGLGNGEADIVESVAVARWPESEALQVEGGGGGGAVPDPLLLSDGTALAPTYSFASDPDTGMYLPAANQLGFAAGGVELLRVGSADVDVMTGHLNLISNTGAQTMSLGEWSAGFNYAAVETPSMVVLMGNASDVNSQGFMRTKGTGSLNLGTNNSNDLTIANGGAISTVGNLTVGSGLTVSGTSTLNGGVSGTGVQTTGSAPGVSELLKSHTNGYTYLGWLNTVSGSNTATPSRIYTNSGGSDSFVRYMTLENFRTSVADYTVFCNPQTRNLNSTATRTAGSIYWHQFSTSIGGVAVAGAKAVIMNVAARATGNAYVTIWNYSDTTPSTATINLNGTDIGSNQITVGIDSSRRVKYEFNSANGNLIVFDVVGFIF
jgi:hypothetical protein